MLRKTVFFILLFAALAFSVNIIQGDTFYKTNFKAFPFKEAKKEPFYVFFSSIAGFRTLVADFLWMDTVQYIGDKENGKEQYKQLYPRTRDIITLDPNFTYPYISASGMLFFEMNEKEKALELIKYGIEKNPSYFQLSLYLAAFTYAKADNLRMSIFNIESAVKQENHPPMLERIMGSMYLKLAEKEPANKDFWTRKAIRLWLTMYEHPTEPQNKVYAEQKLREAGIIK